MRVFLTATLTAYSGSSPWRLESTRDFIWSSGKNIETQIRLYYSFIHYTRDGYKMQVYISIHSSHSHPKAGFIQSWRRSSTLCSSQQKSVSDRSASVLNPIRSSLLCLVSCSSWQTQNQSLWFLCCLLQLRSGRVNGILLAYDHLVQVVRHSQQFIQFIRLRLKGFVQKTVCVLWTLQLPQLLHRLCCWLMPLVTEVTFCLLTTSQFTI